MLATFTLQRCVFMLVAIFLNMKIVLAVADGDLENIYLQRLNRILESNLNPQLANQWMIELTENGNWTDVDYTTGCDARRANWPAQDHFHRIITMATYWHSNQNEDKNLLSKISLALDYWFDRDYKEDDCINAGGVASLKCPCGTPGFWNTNWYDQMLLMPGLVSTACLILKSNLTKTQVGNCTTQPLRAYVRIDGDPNGMMGPQTGANMLDLSSIGLSLALFTLNTTLIEETINRYYNECQITSSETDGIRVDGSFMQHDNQIYTGNYGKVFINNMLRIFLETRNTSLVPPSSVQTSFLTLIEACEWFIYLKNEADDPRSPIFSWQFSVIGRMVSHKYEDWHGIDLSFQDILDGTSTWANHQKFVEIIGRLRSTELSVNPGGLVGTRFFHTSDYMVHRGENYIVTLKMFSNRTTNSECNNAQNPYGFHLSDGTIYTYITGNEYTNVYGAWDWNLIPGTTVDYDVTPLTCGRVQFRGQNHFVGGVALGNAGIALMNYTNPYTGSLNWLKTYFFFPNAYAVQFFGDVVSEVPISNVYTVLDQRQLNGPVYVDGNIVEEEFFQANATSVWHDNVIYEFVNSLYLTVDTRERQSNWSEIGISEGNETQNIFSAYFQHHADISSAHQFTYIVRLNVLEHDLNGGKDFVQSGVKLLTSRVEKTFVKVNAEVVGATYGEEGTTDRTISFAFITAGEFITILGDITKVETDSPILLMFQRNDDNNGWNLAVADPTQLLSTVNVSVYTQDLVSPVSLQINLPSGDWAGSSSVVKIPDRKAY